MSDTRFDVAVVGAGVFGAWTAWHLTRAGKRVLLMDAYGYIYDLAGGAVAEVSSSGSLVRGEVYAGGRHLATYWNNTTYFIHADWLGTERARSNVSGASVETCTNLPFGDWQSCTGTDVSPLHFTGKMRDAETGNDFFGARYFNSLQGRWLTPDWSSRQEAVPYSDPTNPQTLNLYAYVGNNPISRFDSDGHADPQNQGSSCGNGANDRCGEPGRQVESGSGVASADTYTREQAQQQAQQLSAADVTKIIQQAQKSGADPATLGIQIFNSLGNNVSVTGNALRQGIKDSKVTLDDTTNVLLANVTSVTKRGDQVTITNSQKATQQVGGYTLNVGKTVSFAVGVSKETGLPGLYNVKGIGGGVGGLTGSLSKAQVIMEGSHKFLELDVRKWGVPIPGLHPKIPLD